MNENSTATFREDQVSEELDPTELGRRGRLSGSTHGKPIYCFKLCGREYDLCELHDVSNTVQVVKGHDSQGGWSLNG